MPDAMPIVFGTSGGLNIGKSWNGYAMVWVNPQGKVFSPTYNTDYKVSNNWWALVLDRKDPTKAPAFMGPLPNNTDVPTKLEAVLTPDHLLFFMATAATRHMPQGDLYEALSKNGAGAALTKIEQLATYNGCGMEGSYLYSLVSVPGTGTAGIEKSEPGVSAYSYGDPHVSVSVSLRFQTLLSLIPGPHGYTPMEIA